MRLVGNGFTAVSRRTKPIDADITVSMDWVCHWMLGRIGLNHVKKAGTAM